MKKALTRSRIKNVVIYFAKNTHACGKIKLFKLLYMLDFEHFRNTGKSVTGYEYQAWKFGPVPVALMQEWEELDDDLKEVIEIIPEKVIDYTRETVKVRDGVEFNDDDFTPRQLALMQDLADRYRDTRSPKMIDVTHEQNGAWDKIWSEGLGAQKTIPYELAIPEESLHRDRILQMADEAKGVTSVSAGEEF